MILNANALAIPLANKSVQCVVTSPPYYGLRDYGVSGQIGLEETPEAYVAQLVAVFREVRRVLKDDGVLWLNLGDSYNGSAPNKSGQNGYDDGRENRDKRYSNGEISGLKPKDLIGIPWRVAFALQADGWWLRQDIIWAKPNPMPESVTDRCTKAHEYVFLLTKSARYYYDAEAVKEPSVYPEDDRKARASEDQKRAPTDKVSGIRPKQDQVGKRQYTGFNARYDNSGPYPTRNLRSVWNIATQPTPFAHFATMPEKLVKPCILAGSRAGDIVLDPFSGSGTVGKVAAQWQREFIGIELNPAYIKLAEKRVQAQVELFV